MILTSDQQRQQLLTRWAINLSAKHNPITTILGVILLTIGCCFGICVWIVPFFYEVKSPILGNWWIYIMPVVPMTLGLISIFSPDKWISSGTTALNDAEEKIASK